MTTPERPVFPPGVLEALKSGNKMEALRLMRQAKGGLADGKAMVEALQKVRGAMEQAQGKAATLRPPSIRPHHSATPHPLPRSRPGLSPGEEPRTGGQFGWVFLILVGVLLVIWLLSPGTIDV